MDLSVIVIIYNVEAYIEECLESVWRSVRKLNAEVILIDDGSTDGSGAAAQSFAEAHKGFIYHRKKNGGASTARNAGIQLAHGDYLRFVDGDDVLVGDLMAEMLEVAKKTDAQITLCDAARLSPDGTIRSSSLHTKALTTLPTNITNIREHPELLYDCLSWDKLIRRDFYLESGAVFPEGFAIQDYPTITTLFLQADRVAVLRELGYLWRVRGDEGIPSTTQRHLELRNLTDRIEMNTRTFALIDACEDSDAIRFEAEVKLLTMDFNGYLAKLHIMPKNMAQQCVELIASAVEKLVRVETLEAIQLRYRQRAQLLLNRDIAGLIRLEDHLSTTKPDVAVVIEDKHLAMEDPDNFFYLTNPDYTQDVTLSFPRSRVESLVCKGSQLELRGWVRTPCVSLPQIGDQEIEAFLINDLTGAKTPLECSVVSSEIDGSLERARTYDPNCDLAYNYLGSGFSVSVDLEELASNDCFAGANAIVLHYANHWTNGYRVLRGASRMARKEAKSIYYAGKRWGRASWDRRGTFFLRFEPRQRTVVLLPEKGDRADTTSINRLLEEPMIAGAVILGSGTNASPAQTYKNCPNVATVKAGTNVTRDIIRNAKQWHADYIVSMQMSSPFDYDCAALVKDGAQSYELLELTASVWASIAGESKGVAHKEAAQQEAMYALAALRKAVKAGADKKELDSIMTMIRAGRRFLIQERVVDGWRLTKDCLWLSFPRLCSKMGRR